MFLKLRLLHFALSDDETAQITSKKLIDPATGQPTDETTVTVAGEGTHNRSNYRAVTFTPEKTSSELQLA